MARMLWLGLLLWRRLEALLEGYKTGAAARSIAVGQMIGLARETLLPWLWERGWRWLMR